ncbi:MAG: MFS transporter [Bacteroidota bacterium]
MSDNQSSSLSIFPVLLVNFIGMLGYSIVLPILVYIVNDFGGNEFVYGLLGSIYPLFQLFGGPLLGRWSDQIGRRRVLMISQSGTLLAWGLFIVALLLPKLSIWEVDSSWAGSFIISIPLILLFFARALDGLTGGNVSVANAYLADISNDENRKANFGKMASSTSLGFIIGPMLAGLLGATILGTLLPVAVAALISLTAIFVIYKVLPETPSVLMDAEAQHLDLKKMFQHNHKACYKMENCPDTGFLAILKMPTMALMYGIYFLTFLGFSFFYAGFPVYASTILAWDSSQLGIFLTISSLIMVISQGPLLSWLSPRFNESYLILAGSFLIASSFALLTIENMIAIYSANVLLSVGNGIMWPSYMALLAQKGGKDVQGTIQGYAASMGSLASIFGLILGGLLIGQMGSFLFYCAAAILGIIFLLSFRLLPRFQSST